jgi:predicted metalloprotease
MRCVVRIAVLTAGITFTAFGAFGCGDESDDNGQTVSREEAKDKVEEIDKEVPSATSSTDPPIAGIRTRTSPATMADFLDEMIQSVHNYWTRTLTSGGRPQPAVLYNWIRRGEVVQTQCKTRDGRNDVTSDNTAAYCPADDTIYISQQFAYNLWHGIIRGQQTDARPGDFGVAYVVAHEYAHNVQHELRIYDRQDLATKNFELQADCMAGTWANSTYYEGVLEPGDPEEAVTTADRLGDFDFFNPDHHGTPEERQTAFRTGYNSGDPGQCNAYTP